MGHKLNQDNVVNYVDSSSREIKNRQPLKLENLKDENLQQEPRVIERPGDSRENSDPLNLNLVFSGVHEQYIKIFIVAANLRNQKSVASN